MYKEIFAISFFLFPVIASAQTTISSQIDAVANAENQEEAQQQALYKAQQEAYQRSITLRERAAEKQRALAAANARYKAQEVMADKKREQNYEDKNRDLDLEERKLRLQSEKIRVARENDFIDRDLGKQDAENDVIRSKADVNRNLSSGEKSLLEKNGNKAELEGQAAVKKESGWFSR